MKRKSKLNAGLGKKLALVVFANILIAAVTGSLLSSLGIGSTNLSHVISVTAISFFTNMILFFATSRIIIAPLKRIEFAVNNLAANRRTIAQKLSYRSNDELGDLSLSINSFLDTISTKIKNIKGHTDTLNESSQVMLNLAGDVLGKCSQTTQNTNNAASSGEQISSNMTSVSAAVEQAASNITTVATAAEEMSNTISEIAKNTETAREVTASAVTMSEEVSESMKELSASAGKITQVTEAIADISEQTNLLALNATIEAARAGEAGKGFAVVANEIKTLAAETSNATSTIKEMLDGIQTSSEASEKHIFKITEVIRNVSENVNTISFAVKEQSISSNEIAENASQASLGVKDISENIAEATVAMTSLADDITDVNRDASGISFNMLESKINIDELTTLSGDLKEATNRFKTGPAPFPIGKVKTGHMAWRTTLESVLAGVKTMDHEEVVSHRDCDFGKWYFGEGQKFSSNPIFQKMGIYHEEVHSLAKEIIKLYNAGSKESARNKMADFITAKENMFELLDQLYLVQA